MSVRKLLFYIFYPDHHEENGYIKSRLDKALSSLHKELVGKLPKKKEEEGTMYPEDISRIRGYNTALQDVIKMLGDEFK